MILQVDSMNISIFELIHELDERFSQSFEDLIINNKDKTINPAILIFVNNREIQTLQKLNTLLFDGDHIVFLSSIHGGSLI